MPPRPRLVLFDLDGVLADYDRSARCATMARAAGADETVMFEAMFGDEGLEHASDRGEIGLQGSLDGLRARHGWALDAERFIDARRASTRVRPEMMALCARLSAQARLAMFTNNGDWVIEHLARIAPELPQMFGSATVSSGQIRQWKPQPAAFLACLARLGEISATDTLFIDDNADNVAGALAAGMDALLYTDFAELRAQLRARGFELEGEIEDAP